MFLRLIFIRITKAPDAKLDLTKRVATAYSPESSFISSVRTHVRYLCMT